MANGYAKRRERREAFKARLRKQDRETAQRAARVRADAEATLGPRGDDAATFARLLAARRPDPG